MVNIDKEIVQTFKLGKGLRSDKEDLAIRHKVTELCFDEFISFIAENSNKTQLKKLEKEVKKMRSKGARLKVMTESMQQIYDFQRRLDNRLTYFIKSLVKIDTSKI